MRWFALFMALVAGIFALASSGCMAEGTQLPYGSKGAFIRTFHDGLEGISTIKHVPTGSCWVVLYGQTMAEAKPEVCQ